MSEVSIYRQRVEQLRQIMQNQGIDALIIPSADPHMSEYLPSYWQGREWVSGFTGSVGTLVITQDYAGLWTDSRYWVQAPIQLAGSGIELQKMQQRQPTFANFLAEHLSENATVAIDGEVLALGDFDVLQTAFAKKQIKLMTDKDLLNEIWQDRPSLPTDAIVVHDQKFLEATTVSDKLQAVRADIQAQGADYHLISSLDDIAWLTDLRGSDVSFNPLFLSHILISQDAATLFVKESKLTDDAKERLAQAGITIADYHQAAQAVAKVSGSLLIDPAKVAVSTVAGLSDDVTVIRATNPTTIFKGVKSDVLLNHVREAMRQDGVALCEFFAQFEQKLANNERISELDIDTMLEQARSRQPYYVSASFDTIAGFKGNGAIVHYKATPESFSYLDGSGLLLIDSGAQYQNGTTDITRMAGVGEISDEQKYDVTYVLKAHIALAQAHYPANFSSIQLDVLARNQMWQQGLDYGHGTGHGVGYFLNVHEGPQVITHYAAAAPERVMKLGMITSNEPGLYREGKWGVRLENLVATVKAFETEFGEFYKFEDLTLCPFDTRLILPELLTQEEKNWLNSYHQRVHDELIDRVDGIAKDWLIERTQAI